MKDILEIVDNSIKDDPFIMKYVDVIQDIYYNQYPPVESINRPIIVLDEIDEPRAVEFGDNNIIAYSYLIQINVYTKGSSKFNARKIRNEISQRIADLLREKLSMNNTSSGKPEYDEDYDLYLSVRRFEGTFYFEK